jgi:transcriptional regulator with XRE-family HTH domain
MMLGTRLRQARQSRRLSLQEVAVRAKISVATLSRIERDKQGLDTAMLLTLGRILRVAPHELLQSESEPGTDDVLASRIAALSTRQRIDLWHELKDERSKDRTSRAGAKKLADQVDELIAQIEFLHAEIESVQKRLRSR